MDGRFYADELATAQFSAPTEAQRDKARIELWREQAEVMALRQYQRVLADIKLQHARNLRAWEAKYAS